MGRKKNDTTDLPSKKIYNRKYNKNIIEQTESSIIEDIKTEKFISSEQTESQSPIKKSINNEETEFSSSIIKDVKIEEFTSNEETESPIKDVKIEEFTNNENESLQYIDIENPLLENFNNELNEIESLDYIKIYLEGQETVLINNDLLDIQRFNKEKTEYTLNEIELNNILIHNPKIINKHLKFNLLKELFFKYNEGILFIQIIDGNIKFIEKKGYESRNQSVIDLLLKTNNYKKLPNALFLVFTNDFIKDYSLTRNLFLYTFCKNHKYNTSFFPNFNFNHWLEANIQDYETIYHKFNENQISWNDKKETIFWTGSNTNIIRKKIYDTTLNNPNFFINIIDINKSREILIPIEDHIKYKYLLNMNGHSYGGRLNYLFLTGSCIIILKNEDKDKCFEEFFYKYFIPEEDYIEILYNDKEKTDNIIKKINYFIKNNNCEEISKRCYEKAKKIFQMNNIYEYIHISISAQKDESINESNSYINNNTFYTPGLNYFYKKRLSISNNQTTFWFQGKDFELNIYDNKNIINLKIINDISKISYNNNVIVDKYTPLILIETKNQQYQILLKNNELHIIIDTKFNVFKSILPIENFNITDIDIKTEIGGWWIT